MLLAIFNNQVLIQFGNGIGNTSTIVQLPKAYSKCYSLVCTNCASAQASANANCSNLTLTSFIVHTKTSDRYYNEPYKWISIGY